MRRGAADAGLRRQAALVVVACGILTACSGNPQAGASVARPTVLTCRESASQIHNPGARWVGGVGSPGLRGGFPASSLRLAYRQRSKDGHLYVLWKDPLAVAPAAGPYRTITVVSPPSARLLFAAPSRWATLSGTILPVLPRSVRLSACGQAYATYFGAIMVRRWTCVTLAVAGPAGRLGTVAVPIGVMSC